MFLFINLHWNEIYIYERLSFRLQFQSVKILSSSRIYVDSEEQEGILRSLSSRRSSTHMKTHIAILQTLF